MNTKIEIRKCPRCTDSYPKDRKHFKYKKKGATLFKATYCRTCWNRYMRGGRKVKGLYTRDPITHKTNLTEEHKLEVKRAGCRRGKKVRVEKCRAIVRAYLQKQACQDCGINNWLVLEFDHRDPNKKTGEVGKYMRDGRTTKLLSEIKKCDVVCSNCHTLRSFAMFGSWRLSLL